MLLLYKGVEFCFFKFRLLNYKFLCVKYTRIRSYFGPYSVEMRENADQNNFKYGHFFTFYAVFSYFSIWLAKNAYCTIISTCY